MKVFIAIVGIMLLSACTVSEKNLSKSKFSPEESERLVKIRLELGLNYFQRGQLDAAEEELLAVIELDPNSEKGYVALGRVFAMRKNITAANLAFKEALLVNENDVEARGLLAYYLCADNKVKEGFSVLQKGIKIDPRIERDLNIQVGYGYCYLKNHQYRESEHYLRLATSRGTSSELAFLSLIQVLFAQGEHFIARAFIERAMSLGYDGRDLLIFAIKNESRLNDGVKRDQYYRLFEEKYPDDSFLQQ